MVLRHADVKMASAKKRQTPQAQHTTLLEVVHMCTGADNVIVQHNPLQERAGEPLPAEPIERRYCQATALLSDHVSRTVHYVIEHPMGFAAAGECLGGFSPVASWRAEGCVLGLDEWHVYGANCESLRRFPEEGRTGYGYVSK